MWLVLAAITQLGLGRARVGGGSAAALGAPLGHRPPDTDPGPPRRFGSFSGAGHAREAAETLRRRAGSAQRAPLGSGAALPGAQEDH
jgi:hypothetical protein